MSLTKMCRGLLWGGAFALLAAGCKDDDTNPGMDSGTDSGMTDSGPTDSGQDAGPALPVYLRLAHLAFGTGVGPVHICANDGAGNRSLLTTDALATGNFRSPNMAIPFPYGSVTRHLVLEAEVQAQVAGRTIEVFKAAEAGVAISGNPGDALRFATCTPTGAAIDSASVGVPGSGAEIILTPGGAFTFVIAGSAGPEITADPSCVANAALCPAPYVMSLTDEVSSASTTDARLRTVLLDGRRGPTPGLCHTLATTPGTFTPVTTSGLLSFTAAPAYEDVDPLAGASAMNPAVLTMHINGAGSTPPCGLTGASAPYGVYPSGYLANALLINGYATAAAPPYNQPVATIRPALVAGEVTTLFIAPVITEFYAPNNATTPGMACNPAAYAPASMTDLCVPKGVDPTDSLNVCTIGDPTKPACSPGGNDPANGNAVCVIGNPATPACTDCNPATASTPGSCIWLTQSIPAADQLPPAP